MFLSKEITYPIPKAPDYLEQIQNITPIEQQGVNAFLKIANEDSKMNVIEAVKNYRNLMTNEYECPPIGVRKYSMLLKICNMIYIGFNRLSRRWKSNRILSINGTISSSCEKR